MVHCPDRVQLRRKQLLELMQELDRDASKPIKNKYLFKIAAQRGLYDGVKMAHDRCRADLEALVKAGHVLATGYRVAKPSIPSIETTLIIKPLWQQQEQERV